MFHEPHQALVQDTAAASATGWVGRALARDEDDALLRGEGRYIADLSPSGCLHAVFVRSAMAHARISLLDLDAVRGLPGVRLVLTGEALVALGHLAVNPLFTEARPFNAPLLAVDRVLCVGAPIALVVADSASAARDAAEAMFIDYDPLDAHVDAAEALRAPALLPHWPDNLAFEKRWRQGDFEAAARHAAHRVQVHVCCPRVAPMALETRGLLAHWHEGRLTVWIPSQSPHRARIELARVLNLPLDQVRTIAPDVGGAFGGKASLCPEDVVLAYAALQLDHPVRWIASRNEDFVSAPQGRAGAITASACFAADGQLLALRAEVLFALGCWGTFSAPVPALNAGRILPGPYRCDVVDIVVRGAVTNTAAVGIYRGAGRPEAAIVMERLMDEGARVLGMDPVAIRRRNLVPATAMPWTTPTGQTLDSGDYAGLLDATLALAGLPALRAEQQQRRAAGECIGIGLNLYVEPCGTGWESARLTRFADGRLRLASGTSAQGQGHRTVLAQIAADVLGVSPHCIEVVQGDSDDAPAGIGALASRSTAIGGSAVLRAASALQARLDAEPGARERTTEVETRYTAVAEAWSAGCCIVMAAVDAATGEVRVERAFWVDDAGVVVNPLLFEGQLQGGFAQGLGQALMEHIHYDSEGQIVTGSLMDYAVPRADDMPVLRHASRPSHTRANLLGAKGVGESGCIAAPAAILNAAIDALAPHGVTDLALPLTAERVWQALQQALSTRGDKP